MALRDQYPLTKMQNLYKDFAISHNKCGLFLTMSWGKTRITLEALTSLPYFKNTLVIAPIAIAQTVWTDEIDKWDIPIKYQSLILNEKGKPLSKAKRHELYQDILNQKEPKIYFLNRELTDDLIKNLPVQNGQRVWPFPYVVIDELQSFKNYSSVRFKALKQVVPLMERFIGLTGTPQPKNLLDLWSQIYLMDEGKRLGKNITAYRNQYFKPTKYINGHAVDFAPLPFAEQEIYTKISDIVVSSKNIDADLPDLTYCDTFVAMDAKEEKLYKEFMKKHVLTTIDGDTIEAKNAAVLTAKLSQMASGALYTNAANNEYLTIHEKKLEMCRYLIEQTNDNIIVAYHFKSDKDMLCKYFEKHKIPYQIFDKSPKMIKDWNDGKIPVMLLQPASAGHGLNLQHGGATLIWYTIPWSLEEYTQTNARLYRRGQTKQTNIYHILTKNTIDLRILSILGKKNISQMMLMEAVKATINE